MAERDISFINHDSHLYYFYRIISDQLVMHMITLLHTKRLVLFVTFGQHVQVL